MYTEADIPDMYIIVWATALCTTTAPAVPNPLAFLSSTECKLARCWDQ